MCEYSFAMVTDKDDEDEDGEGGGKPRDRGCNSISFEAEILADTSSKRFKRWVADLGAS